MVAKKFNSRQNLSSANRLHSTISTGWGMPEVPPHIIYRDKLNHYNQSIDLILANANDLSATYITLSPGKFLGSAQAVLEPSGKLPALDTEFYEPLKDRATQCASAFTFAVLPSRAELRDTAIIYSYLHHDLRILSEAFSILNAERSIQSSIAPKVIGYRDVKLPNGGSFSGAILVVEGLKHLNPKDIKEQNYPQKHIYERMTLGLLDAVASREAKAEEAKAKAEATGRANNVVQLRPKR